MPLGGSRYTHYYTHPAVNGMTLTSCTNQQRPDKLLHTDALALGLSHPPLASLCEDRP